MIHGRSPIQGPNKTESQSYYLYVNMESNLATLEQMGYNREISIAALTATGNNIDQAFEWIETMQTAQRADNDGEFDLIAAAAPAPSVQEPTVFHTRVGGDVGLGHFAEGVESDSIEELVDARIQMFNEMGFTNEQAIEALRQCNNDVNEALTLLLSHN